MTLNSSKRHTRDRLISGCIIALTFGWSSHSDVSESAEIALKQSAKDAITDCIRNEYQAKRNFHVNGHALNESQSENVEWVRKCVVPVLRVSHSDAPALAARATWWALREGILDMPKDKIHRYSNCHEHGRDRRRSDIPLYRCGGSIWQVGMAAIQVNNYPDKYVAGMVDKVLGPVEAGINVTDALEMSAELAGFRPGSKVYDAIVRSTGKLRKSWLLRNPLIGMPIVQNQEVLVECFKQNKKWCYTSGWLSAKYFGASRRSMLKSIQDLTRIYQQP
ncbi:MAG: hypothetical protein EOP09_13465 [Proteobacteria bacterium]|nr:MAG: hypothetical protein EOP09_13465 [Pseudomonadota bacterium]